MSKETETEQTASDGRSLEDRLDEYFAQFETEEEDDGAEAEEEAAEEFEPDADPSAEDDAPESEDAEEEQDAEEEEANATDTATDDDAEPEGEEPEEEATDASGTAEKANPADAEAEAVQRGILEALHKACPETAEGIQHLSDLSDPPLYLRLLRAGFGAGEAYTVMCKVSETKTAPASEEKETAPAPAEQKNPTESVPLRSTKTHVRSSAPQKSTARDAGMTRSELREARDLFPGMTDRELNDLYRKVAK